MPQLVVNCIMTIEYHYHFFGGMLEILIQGQGFRESRMYNKGGLGFLDVSKPVWGHSGESADQQVIY